MGFPCCGAGRMLRSRILGACAAVVLFGAATAAVAPAAHGQTRYVSDELVITFRTQPSNRGEIIRNLSTGTAMELLESPEGSEWARVRLNDGREGWVRRQYLTGEPIARTRLQTANREVERLSRTVTDLREQLQTAQRERDAASQSNASLTEQVDRLEQELAEIRRVSSSALETAAENERLTELNARLRGELDTLLAERDRLAENARERWMLIGAGLVLGGVFLGVILKARPRRSGWL